MKYTWRHDQSRKIRTLEGDLGLHHLCPLRRLRQGQPCSFCVQPLDHRDGPGRFAVSSAELTAQCPRNQPRTTTEKSTMHQKATFDEPISLKHGRAVLYRYHTISHHELWHIQSLLCAASRWNVALQRYQRLTNRAWDVVRGDGNGMTGIFSAFDHDSLPLCARRARVEEFH